MTAAAIIAKLQSERDILRSALVGIVECDGRAELGELRETMVEQPECDNRTVALAAIDALILTLPEDA